MSGPDVNDALAGEQDALAEMVVPLGPAELGAPSRCPGWSVADVLVHLAQTNELAVASVRGQLDEAAAAGPDVTSAADVDEWAARAVDVERPDDPTEARDRWLASAAAQHRAFAGCDPSARVLWVSGELAARSLATTRLAETWIHGTDIAVGLGTELRPTDRLWHIARLAHRTLPYAFGRAGREAPGPIAFVLTGPDGAQWAFGDPGAPTTIRGSAVELCEIAGQRRAAADSSLLAEGPDAEAALAAMRTFA